VAFTCQEKVKFPGCFHFWQHLMPEIGYKDEEFSDSKRKSPFDGIELLPVGNGYTFQLIANLHLLIPAIKNVIQFGYVI
jgi:hypothetical protein